MKLSHPVLFSDILNSTDLIPDSKSSYRLSAILVHTGTASGGHYRVYIQDKSRRWLDFNDSVVEILEEADKAALLWNDFNKTATTSAVSDSQRNVIYENAYLLMYSRIPENGKQSGTEVSIPADLVEEIRLSNAHLADLRAAYKVHMQMTELHVYVAPGGQSDKSKGKIILNVLCSKTLEDVTEMAYVKAGESGAISSADTPISLCRLRRYNPVSDRLGETFGGREGEQLSVLGLTPMVTLALESRAPNAAFPEFNPKEMALRLVLWSNEGQSGEPIPTVVPGEELATVGSLRSCAAAALHVDVNRVVVIRADLLTVVELDDDTKLLRRDCNVWPGEEVVVEILPEGSTHGQVASKACASLRAGKRDIKIQYNNPNQPVSKALVDEEGDTLQYPLTLATSLDATLGDAKAVIATALGVEKGTFHLKRNQGSPQLKDEGKTLDELGFTDGSIIHVEVSNVLIFVFMAAIDDNCLYFNL